MDTVRIATAAVTGARHLRAGRNGQDAVAGWAVEDRGALVVCDGCSAGSHSEFGAQLGAQLVIAAVRDELRGARPAALWSRVRERVVGELRCTAARFAEPGYAVSQFLLFTVVAAAWRDDELAIWAIGDGCYRIGDRVHVLEADGDNRPPYVAYDLLGEPSVAHLDVATTACGSVAVASDGVAQLGLARFTGERWYRHGDALRRELVVHSRGSERIDWHARRVVRSPALLQDDGAIAMASWGPGLGAGAGL